MRPPGAQPAPLPWTASEARSGRSGESAQRLGHAPGLSDAAAWCVRRLGVEDLDDRPQAGFVQVRLEAAECLSCTHPVIRVDPEPGVNEGTGEPSPDRSLVIRRVARAQVAEV